MNLCILAELSALMTDPASAKPLRPFKEQTQIENLTPIITSPRIYNLSGHRSGDIVYFRWESNVKLFNVRFKDDYGVEQLIKNHGPIKAVDSDEYANYMPVAYQAQPNRVYKISVQACADTDGLQCSGWNTAYFTTKLIRERLRPQKLH